MKSDPDIAFLSWPPRYTAPEGESSYGHFTISEFSGEATVTKGRS